MKYFVMSKLLFICMLLFLSYQFANCQIDNTYVKSNPNSPEISFTKTIHNFGSLQKNQMQVSILFLKTQVKVL